ncbi:hypothetical protein EVAR_4057_1 [Eumeta japonica]|uniref:Uncharacterized protein n=1 Tax=Eumeta variegata TaxID=151549 RepID=A0A4C1T7E6_EUMVA|nr:hypothetical protein EVAR_4057_1 [Eumeta japonica]
MNQEPMESLERRLGNDIAAARAPPQRATAFLTYNYVPIEPSAPRSSTTRDNVSLSRDRAGEGARPITSRRGVDLLNPP